MGVLKVTKKVLIPDWEALRITPVEVGLRTRLGIVEDAAAQIAALLAERSGRRA